MPAGAFALAEGFFPWRPKEFQVIRVDAQPVIAALSHECTVRNGADEGFVAGTVGTFHAVAPGIPDHGSAVPAVRNLAAPVPATGVGVFPDICQ